MGLEVTPALKTEGDEDMSKHDVDQVTGLVREVAEVGELARRVASDLRVNLGDIREGLSAAQELSEALQTVGAELRGALGTQTNRPPRDGGGAVLSGVGGSVAGGDAVGRTDDR